MKESMWITRKWNKLFSACAERSCAFLRRTRFQGPLFWLLILDVRLSVRIAGSLFFHLSLRRRSCSVVTIRSLRHTSRMVLPSRKDYIRSSTWLLRRRLPLLLPASRHGQSDRSDIDALICGARKRLCRADIFIHPAVIKLLRELDLIIRYEEIVCCFHLKMRIMQKMQVISVLIRSPLLMAGNSWTRRG